MGVIYKLKPEIINFIHKAKEKKPSLSCRKLVLLIQEKFQIKLSKSHVNAAIKKAGLSNKIGRTPKRKRGGIEAENLGSLILKAADSLVGGTAAFQQIIALRLKEKANSLELFESLLYGEKCPLWKLNNKSYTSDQQLEYLKYLQNDESLNREISALFPSLFQDVLFLRLTFSDGSTFYLDGQFYTLWSSPYIPYDFSTTFYKIKSYIKRCFNENHALVIFTAPGYELTTKEWFEFLVKLNSSDKKVVKVSLLDTNLQELESLPVDGAHKPAFIFGLWPWQHRGSRKIEPLNGSTQWFFSPQNRHFILENCSVKLSQSNTDQILTLNGIALKKDAAAKPDLFILSNLEPGKISPEELAEKYLERWPNLQAGFEDFSRKIEVFTYSASSRAAFPKEQFLINEVSGGNFQETLAAYRRGLDAYVRWYFLPQNYREKDFQAAEERFYSLKAKIITKNEVYLVNFILPPDYAYLKDLNYAIARMNEREIIFSGRRRVWFGTA